MFRCVRVPGTYTLSKMEYTCFTNLTSRVSDLIDNYYWYIPDVLANRAPDVVDVIISINNQKYPIDEDYFIWKNSKDGNLSLKQAYKS